MAGLLAAMPKETQSFVAMKDVGEVAAKAGAFAKRTGINLPLDQPSIVELATLRVRVQAGLPPRGAAAVVYLDSEAYKDRNTLFLLPVSSPDTFVEYASAKEVEAGLYQIGNDNDVRFLTFRDRYAIFSASVRTARSVRDGQFGEPPDLSTQRLGTAKASDVYAHVDLHRTMASRQDSSERFRKAVATKIVGDPTLQDYSKLLLGYMVAINEVFEQLDALDIGLTFNADDLAVSLAVKFADEGSIATALETLGSATSDGLRWLPLDRPVVSTAGLTLNSEAVKLAAVRFVDFVMQSSPQSQKNVQPKTREDTIKNVGELMDQVTGEMATMSILPDPASGAAEAGVAVMGIRDKDKFAAAAEGLFGNLLRVGNEVGSRVAVSYLKDQERYRDVVINYIKPLITFTSKQHQELFDERAKKVYGPDGFLYRMAVMNDRVIFCSGSDQRAFRAAIDLALDGKTVALSAELEQVRKSLPAKRNVEAYFNLSAVLSGSLSLAGTAEGAAPGPITLTDEDRKFLANQAMIGLAVSLDKGTIHAESRLGYEQLANAMTFIQRHLPPVVSTPPTTTVEPKPEEPKVTPEPPAEPATPKATPEPPPVVQPSPPAKVPEGPAQP